MIGGLIKGLVSRFLPQSYSDGDEKPLRINRYGEVVCYNTVRKQHAIAEDGCYFTVNNAQTGLATAAAPTTFSATNPFLLICNTDNVGGKSIFLDYAMLLATVAGTAGASLQVAVTLDPIATRYSSGGTEITSAVVNVSTLGPIRNSVAKVYGGNITASAASPNVRTIVGNRFFKGAIPVAGDEYSINFGPVEMFNNISAVTIAKTIVSAPPVIVAPQSCALVHIWLPSQSAASSYAPELGWWER